jgi:hypothetical protein
MKLAELIFVCSDSPYSLVLATLNSIPELTGTTKDGFAFGVYTGDLVSHDSEFQLSRWECRSPSHIWITDTIIVEVSRSIVR